MDDAIANIERTIAEMRRGMDEGRYRFERVHVEADFCYLLDEARRARAERVKGLREAAIAVRSVLRSRGDKATRRRSYSEGVAWRQAGTVAAELLLNQADAEETR